MLTPEQLARRDGKVSASFVPMLVAGKKEAIYNKFLELVGDPSWQPPDFSLNWPVIQGSAIEIPALDYYERKHGCVLSRRGEVVDHPARPYVCCTLDCYRASDSTVMDVKAIGAYRRLDDVLNYYTPQLVIQRACVGAEQAALLVVHGGAEPQECPVTWDAEYESRVWRLVDDFYECVCSLTPPNDFGALRPPVKAEKAYDFHGRNEFANEAVVWLENYRSAKLAKKAEERLKEMVPADAAKVTGHNIVITRDKRGYLSLREVKS